MMLGDVNFIAKKYGTNLTALVANLVKNRGPDENWVRKIQATTCVGIASKQGVIVATDGQATEMPGLRIATLNFNKMIELDHFSVLAISGMPSLAIAMGKILRAQFSFDHSFYENEYIPPRSKVNIISQMIFRNLGLAFSYGLVVSPIFGIFDLDPQEPGGRVFTICPEGTIMPEERVEAVGSGQQEARSAIKLSLEYAKKEAKELSLEEAKHLAVRALRGANQTDGGTGPKFFMKTITGRGINDVGPEEIAQLENEIEGGWLL